MVLIHLMYYSTYIYVLVHIMHDLTLNVIYTMLGKLLSDGVVYQSGLVQY